MTQQQMYAGPYAPMQPVPPPPVTSTVLVTLFFGLFGLIPASINAGKARSMGAPTGKYWATFGIIFGVQIVMSLMLCAGAATSVKSGDRAGEQTGVSAATADQITMTEFNQISVGMSRAEVGDIVGSYGEVRSESGYDGKYLNYSSQTVTYDGGFMSSATVTFVDGKVRSKSQLGLK